jgi:hypothetical protein
MRPRNDAWCYNSAPMTSDAELVKAGFDVAFAPVKDILCRLLGPVADEMGGILADPVRVYRYKQTVRLLEKVKAIAAEAGFEPKAVPLKTLLPILENASLEDDDDLHDRWANLLANAARPYPRDTVKPYFTDILRGIDAEEARLLDRLYEYAFTQGSATDDITNVDLRVLAPEVSVEQAMTVRIPPENQQLSKTALNNLMRLGLLKRFSLAVTLSFTPLGLEFVYACSRPKNS